MGEALAREGAASCGSLLGFWRSWCALGEFVVAVDIAVSSRWTLKRRKMWVGRNR